MLSHATVKFAWFNSH